VLYYPPGRERESWGGDDDHSEDTFSYFKDI